MTSEFQAVMTGSPERRIEALRSHLGYPLKQRDPGGSRFWYLRPGEDAEEAEFTCPIAVGFYEELNDNSRSEILQFLTSDTQQQEIHGHYLGRVIPEQPVMYLLLPEGEQQGLVAMILPTETKLRQRQIQTFDWQSEDLQARLGRLQQATLARTDRMQETVLSVVPLVEWAFYKPITTAKELAQQLAAVSRNIEQAIPAVYDAEGNDGYLHNLLRSFQRELLPTLKLESQDTKDYSFSDIYAQTIAYGLFTARVFSYTTDERRREESEPERKETDFNRQNAWELLPETNPFLRRLFRDVSQQPIEVLGDELGDAISEVFSILRAAKIEAILQDFRSKMNREDIVIRFYEDFLAAYKPEMRERRGVYYTPEPVVSYMVRSVDILLKEKFDKPLGLADPEVMILDPACGTGTFLLWIFQLIHQRFEENPEALTEGLEDKSWSGYVRERLLPRVFGFELLMAPYAIAHLKLGIFLEETGYQFDNDKRLGIYLTNTLEEAKEKTDFLFREFIAEESAEAAKIKLTEPIMAVLGNPPYSVRSANNGKWIKKIVQESYYPKDGAKEKNPKILLDDYVKFFRFGQWRIELSHQGILAFVSNHGYLDNRISRKMRQELSCTFDSMYLLDLHGSVKKKETSPDGSADENVFDIQQGVSIAFSVKGIKKSISHSHLYGERHYKYQYLAKNDINSTSWSVVHPKEPFYLFVPRDNDFYQEYKEARKITEIMPTMSSGIKTHRDKFVVDFSLYDLKERIREFKDLNISDSRIMEKYNIKDTRDWKLRKERTSLSEDLNWESHFTSCLYRPFDFRRYFHHKNVVELPRNEVMDHVIERNNLCLIVSNRIETSREFDQVLCSDRATHNHSLCIKEANYVLPLYLYLDSSRNSFEIGSGNKRLNFDDVFLESLEKKLGMLPEPEYIFGYIYSILHSPTYRIRYSEFLRDDFPRIPFTSSVPLFVELSDYGYKLTQLHCMKLIMQGTSIAEFEERSTRAIASGYPKYIDCKVFINSHGDCFTGVPEEVWNFYVGGYQVCHKWLKDRKGRTLSDDDILHYQRIIVALKETIILMQKIDEAIPSWPIE